MTSAGPCAHGLSGTAGSAGEGSGDSTSISGRLRAVVVDTLFGTVQAVHRQGDSGQALGHVRLCSLCTKYCAEV